MAETTAETNTTTTTTTTTATKSSAIQTTKNDAKKSDNNARKIQSNKQEKQQQTQHLISPMKPHEHLSEEHLPPLFLVFVVLLCSGFMLMFSLRDLMMTGRNILGSMDESFLLFTKSTEWFDDRKGWKSTQGGFSAVEQVTTDANNMGGFFVRKVAGAVATAVQLQKLLPLLFPPANAVWIQGHLRPLLVTAMVSNMALVAFLVATWSDLHAGGVTELPRLWIVAMVVETLVLLGFVLALSRRRDTSRAPAVALKPGKTPNSLPSRIVSRTVWMVSSATAIVAIRDLFFTGQIMEFWPKDDLYLEWTNALRHSPPPGSPEFEQHGLESPLYMGDKWMAQYMALNLLLTCFSKLVAATFVRIGADGRGDIQSKLFWQTQAIGNALLLFVFRVFAPAASSASLDLRWHLVAIGYETFLLFLFGFF